jgi:glutamate carboxypeptidase
LNRVPHEAFAEGELRAFDREVYRQGVSSLLALAGTGATRSVADSFPCEVKVQITGESPPWPRNPGSERLLEIWQHAGNELGLPIQPQERGGLSDGNFLWDVVPTLDGLGPFGDNDHCSERSADGQKLPEYVEISSFVPKATLNVRALVRRLTSHA